MQAPSGHTLVLEHGEYAAEVVGVGAALRSLTHRGEHLVAGWPPDEICPDYRGWVDFPVFDPVGFPVTSDGSTTVPGLYFCGVHFMRQRQSALLLGVGGDAGIGDEALARRPE